MNKEFCKNLKNTRITLGLTQAQLANKLNMSPSTIGMYEQGRRKPNIESLRKLCTALNISVDELLNVKIKKFTNVGELDKSIECITNFIKNQDIVRFNKVVLNKDKKS